MLATLCAFSGWFHPGEAAVVQMTPQSLTHTFQVLDVPTVGGLGAKAEATLVVCVVHGSGGQFREAVFYLRGLIL